VPDGEPLPQFEQYINGVLGAGGGGWGTGTGGDDEIGDAGKGGVGATPE
jgi:hypothetical protein